MSFFGGFNDPFFGDMHRMMRHQMRDMEQLMDAMMVDPFSMLGGRPPGLAYVGPRQQMIADGGVQGRSNRHRNPNVGQLDPMASMMMPFGLGGGMFGGIHGMMRQMDQMQQHVMTDPNSHIYTQSTVVSIAPGADGRPQIYEATDSVRKAGDVKETRRSVRDTARGEERMSIGHHIGDRGHVIEKRRDRQTGGKIVEQQEFIGLKDDDARQFDEEWGHATRRAVNTDRYRLADGTGRRGDSGLAIEAGPGGERIYRTASPHDARRARISSSDEARRHSPYHHTQPRRRIVRIEEPPEEQSPSHQQPPSGSSKTGGPIIEEIE